MPSRAWGIALLLAAALAGCGGGNKPTPGLTSGQAQGLVAQLEAVRGAASAHDLSGAEAAVARFKGSVARLRRSGALSDGAARLLRIGAARVLARVKSDNPAPAPQPPVQTAPAPAPTPGPPGKDKKKHDHPKPPKGGGDNGGQGD